MDCVTSTHHGHELTKLEVILKEKTVYLQKELENQESNSLKEWKYLALEAKQVTADFLGHLNIVENELDARVKEFHAKVDEIAKAMKRQLEEIEEN